MITLPSTKDTDIFLQTLTARLEDLSNPDNLELNISKTKELIVVYSKQQEEAHTPISIKRMTVERVYILRFLNRGW